MNYKNIWSDNFEVLYECGTFNTSLEDMPENLVRMVKNADPTVWPILMTTSKIINTIDLQWQNVANNVGMIVIGNAYPKKYTQKVINELQSSGRVSPLSFINANAGAAISICCTAYKFQGPTINLTISDNIREEIATLIINTWLRNGDAKYIFFVTADFNDEGGCVVTNKLVSNGNMSPSQSSIVLDTANDTLF